ncbi:hypothetical protein K9M79_03795 [Candidatus Woesearchaeota archaeon]|nr:hypothetical protein [Candidatus Woesearchaeota archaeon]
MKFNFIWVEIAAIVLFVYLALNNSIGHYIGPSIDHDIPYAYTSSDSFWNLAIYEDTAQSGDFKYYGGHFQGGFDDVIAFHPPLLYHLVPLISEISGIEIHDTNWFILGFLMINSCLVMYLIIRKINRNVALMALPVMLGVFSVPHAESLYQGLWSYLIATIFLIPFGWSIMQGSEKNSWTYIGIFGACLAMTHIPELVFGFLFVMVYMVLKLVIARFNVANWFSENKNVILGGIFAVVLSLNFIIIFNYTWLAKSGEKLSFEPLTQVTGLGMPVVLFSDLGVIGWMALIGGLLTIWNIKKNPELLFPVLMFLLGFSNYFLFGARGLQTRYFWPVYIAAFVGLLFYSIFTVIPKNVDRKVLTMVCTIIIFAFMIFTISPAEYRGSLVNADRYDTLKYISQSTEADSRVLFFFSEAHNQGAFLVLSERVPYILYMNNVIEYASNNSYSRVYRGSLVSDGKGGLPYRNGLFDFGYHLDEPGVTIEDMDLCSFPYIVFDRRTSMSQLNPVFQYSLSVAEKLINSGNFAVVYQNDQNVILKNNLVGGDCVEI